MLAVVVPHYSIRHGRMNHFRQWLANTKESHDEGLLLIDQSYDTLSRLRE